MVLPPGAREAWFARERERVAPHTHGGRKKGEGLQNWERKGRHFRFLPLVSFPLFNKNGLDRPAPRRGRLPVRRGRLWRHRLPGGLPRPGLPADDEGKAGDERAGEKKETREPNKRRSNASSSLRLSLSLSHSLLAQIYGSGVAATALALIPDWPWFNRDGLTWLPLKEVVAESKVGDDSGGDAEEEEEGEEVVAAASPAAGGRQRRLPVIE